VSQAKQDRRRIEVLEDEVKALKQLAVSQGAVNLVLVQLLVQRGGLTVEDAAVVSLAYREGGEELDAGQIAAWARERFANVTFPGRKG